MDVEGPVPLVLEAPAQGAQESAGSFGACTNGPPVELSESVFSDLPSRVALVGLISPKRTHVSSRRREAYAIGLSAIGHLTRTGYL